MARELMVFTFKEAAQAGNYDERPMLPDNVDPQVHLSKNDRTQPFWLICQHDTMIVTLSGTGKVEFKDTSVLHQTYTTGDFIYVPAGTPSRIVPSEQSVHYRYKGNEPGLEGVAWYCEKCGNELYREVWDTAVELVQAAYHRIATAFNADAASRKCKSCGKSHPKIDLKGLRWREIAEEENTRPPAN